MSNVLMPKATAVWLLEETSLTFQQIADFCGLHHLEVAGIANEEVARGIRGVDPIAGGFLAREEIERGEKDEAYKLKPMEQKRIDVPQPKRRGGRFTPIALRQYRPDAVAWFLRHHPEVPDSQIAKLLGTTKSTIEQVRNRTHWNAPNIKPTDPVSLGLCSQIELDAVVARHAGARPRPVEDGPSLRPASETVAADAYSREGRAASDHDADDEEE